MKAKSKLKNGVTQYGKAELSAAELNEAQNPKICTTMFLEEDLIGSYKREAAKRRLKYQQLMRGMRYFLIISGITLISLLGTEDLSIAKKIHQKGKNLSLKLKRATDWHELIPNGYTVVQSAEGDLGGGSKQDVAVTILGPENPIDEKERDVNLFLIFKMGDGKYELYTQAPNAVCWECGGVISSGLLGNLKITNRRVLSVTYDGGTSSLHWGHEAKWRLGPSGNFQLIGWTTSQWGNAGGCAIDVNYITGKTIITRAPDSLSKPKSGPAKISKNLKTIFLKDFDYYNLTSLPGC